MYCINSLSFYKEMQVQVIQYIPVHVQSCSNWGRGNTWYGEITWNSISHWGAVIGYWIKLISVQKKMFSCTDIADLEYFYCKKWIEILWRWMTYQNSNIYNSVAEWTHEKNVFVLVNTERSPQKILEKNSCRRTDNSEI